MSTDTKLQKEAMHILKLTSRTFYIPIKLLNPTLRKTVGSAYLCMRAIDEIEDHEELEAEIKQHLLRSISKLLQSDFDDVAYQQLLKPYENLLPEVTLRLGDWLIVCPENIIGKVKESTSIMADGMALWVEKRLDSKNKRRFRRVYIFCSGFSGCYAI